MRWAPGRAAYVLLAAALWCASLTPRAAPDLAADRAALLAFRDAVGQRLPWDAAAASPCGWRGVRCDPTAARVTVLQLPGASLVGAVPLGTIGNLTALRTLSLRLNALSGGIPADIGSCTELRHLYLQGNQLDGQVPEGFFDLGLLQRLDLSNNRIAGGVSPEFNRLQRLATLYLENNSLNGTLPSNLDLPKLQLFNVSRNNLTGPVPKSLARMPASAFDGTGLCGDPLAPCPTPPPPPPPPVPAAANGSISAKLSTGAIAGIAAGAAVAFLVLIAVILFLCFRCQRTMAEKSAETAADADLDGSPVSVTVASMDMKNATRRSSQATAGNSDKKLVFLGAAPDAPYDLESLLHASAEVIGKGWLGTTYRATLEGGATTVAVKRLRAAPIPEREFRDKVIALGALRHENLVPVRAYFYSREEKLIVYDFVGGGSLCSLLHGGSPERLDFEARARIALAAARGVAFIHGAGPRSCHGNIKSSNVLVADARDGAYVTDHGILRLVGAHVPLKRVTGYRAPEVTDPRRASQETDTYSFGVLLLEALTGKPPVNSVPGSTGGVELPLWVRTVVQEEWTAEVFDASIAVEERVEEEMVRLLQLAVECTDDRPDRRPRMAEVVARIEVIVRSAELKAKADTEDDDFHSISP
ncbi:putative inactive receptor kinase [Zea mays]|uniref:Putative inactive receptor kinase n=1 Tax=Zea mays TaxID=4577 RepID=A0A3L6DW91_MAIZE|nr:putative inactive receptor kinase [Zea mays]